MSQNDSQNDKDAAIGVVRCAICGLSAPKAETVERPDQGRTVIEHINRLICQEELKRKQKEKEGSK